MHLGINLVKACLINEYSLEDHVQDASNDHPHRTFS